MSRISSRASTRPARRRTNSSHRSPCRTARISFREPAYNCAHSTIEENMTTSVTAPVTPERIMQFAWGYVPPLLLEAGPKTVLEIKKETGASERGLTAVMNALVGLDFLAKDKQGYFSLTPESSA